tara:strand:+ start:1524 stop:1964 length:441 start_codon:yes stop_codon:yes gene_type:complete
MSNTCEIWGTTIYVVDKWKNLRKNLLIEITEYHKSVRCTVDLDILRNYKHTTEELRLKELWKADLVLEYNRLFSFRGDKRDVKINVYNYSTVSNENDKSLIRTEQELEVIGEEILKFSLPKNLLDETGFELISMYLIFGKFNGEIS